MKEIFAIAFLAMSTLTSAAEITLVCTKQSGHGGNLSYVVLIDPDKLSMSIDGERLTEVKLDGTEFLGVSEKRRRVDSYGVDRVSMRFGHTGGRYGVREYDVKIQGKCEKESAKF